MEKNEEGSTTRLPANFLELFHWLGKAHCASELQHMRNVVEKTTNGNYGTVLITQVTTRGRPICIQIGHFYYELRVMGSNGPPKLSGYCRKSWVWRVGKRKIRPRWPSCYYANDDWLFQKNNEIDQGDRGGTTIVVVIMA